MPIAVRSAIAATPKGSKPDLDRQSPPALSVHLFRWGVPVVHCGPTRTRAFPLQGDQVVRSLLLEEKVPNFVRRMRWKGYGYLQRYRSYAAYPPTPHPSRRTAAPPSPQGEGLQAPLWLHRCSDALGEAVYTPPHTPGAPSRAASSRRDRPLTSVSKQSAHTVSPPRTHGHRYASAHDGSGAKHTSHRRICVPPPFICKVIMHSDNFLHQFILVRIICQAVFLRLHKNRARLFLHARRVLLF